MILKKELIEYISRLCKIPADEITMEMDLYDSSAVSSLNLLDIMTFAETKYNFLIKPEELIEENFKDVGSFISFIEAKTVAEKS